MYNSAAVRRDTLWSFKAVAVFAAALMLLVSGVAPDARGSEAEVFYSSVGCNETALLLPTEEFGPTAQLSLLVYECESATIGGKTVSPFLVSEIGVFDAGQQRLLRSVTNSRAVSRGLKRLGFNAVYSSGIDYTFPTDGAGEVSATIGFHKGRHSYSFTGTAAASPLPAADGGSSGATYRNTDEDGNPIVLQYEFKKAEPVPGVATATVTAKEDPELAKWLSGETTATGAGPQAKGDWDATGWRDL